jgi:undecaprenol kinase
MNFIKSIGYAWRGVRFVFKHESNFRFQTVAAIAVFALMYYFDLRNSEIIVLLFLIIGILVLELLNSALERFVDLLKPRLHKQAGVVKDIMAGMVLITSIGAVIIGIMIFWPYIIEIYSK